MKAFPLTLAAGLAAFSSLSARDFRPEIRYENLPASDGSNQHCMVFTTVPGVNCRVDWTYDLVNWTREEDVYGLGFEFAVAMREIEAAPPPPEPDPGDPPPAPPGPSTPMVRVSLLFREASGQTPGTVVSWRSLDHGGPANHFLPMVMTSGWSQMPFFWNTYGDHDFFIGGYGGVASPPDPEEAHGPLDAAMIACLEEHFAEINAEIDQSVARARNTPPPAPPAPDAKRFWRIYCDGSLDTDGDGSPDWAEYEMSANGTGAMVEGVNPDPFAADTNGDGIPDGEQLDYDGDGTSDAQDPGISDPAASYPVGPIPRYALFPITNAAPPADLLDPLEINDRGEVLYANGIWQGGVWTQLQGAAESATVTVRAVRINDHGEIIGVVKSDFVGQNGITIPSHQFPGNVVYWPDRNSWCTLVEQGGNGAWMGSPLLGYPGNPGIRFSNNGIIMANSRRFDATANGSLVDDGGFLWTLAGNDRTEGREPISLHDGGALDAGTYWGFEAGPNGGPRIVVDGQQLPSLVWSPMNVCVQPGGGVLALSDQGIASFWNPDTGAWGNPGLYGIALDVDSNGTAIGYPHAGLAAPILFANDWVDIPRWAPDAPEEWASAGTRLLDTTPGGWVLAERKIPNQPDGHAVALPIRPEGNYVPESFPDSGPRHHACGVDDFSIGSHKPGPTVMDRIWIMAPQFSGSSIVTFTSPADPEHPVTITASGIDLGGGQLGGGMPGNGLTDLPVSATSPLASGTEAVADLSMGGVGSVSKPLGFKVMKSRVVKVGLYKVTKTGESPGAPGLPVEPVSLAKHLNDVYRPQVNVTFQVIPMMTLR